MKLTHPNSAQTLDVADDHVEAFASQGWVEAPPAKPKDPEKS